MAQFRPPEKLNFREPRWDAWRSSFQTFRDVTSLDQETDEVQIATLKYSMGPESEEIARSFNLGNCVTYDVILSKFDCYFKPRKNIVRFRRVFQKRVQDKNESVDSYFKELVCAAEQCEFVDREDRIRDQFIFGLVSEVLVEKIENLYLSNPLDFTLMKVVEYAKSNVNTKKMSPETKDKPKSRTVPSFAFANDVLCSKCGKIHPVNKCFGYGNTRSAGDAANHGSNRSKNGIKSIEKQQIQPESKFASNIQKSGHSFSTFNPSFFKPPPALSKPAKQKPSTKPLSL